MLTLERQTLKTISTLKVLHFQYLTCSSTPVFLECRQLKFHFSHVSIFPIETLNENI